ncbi:MULTISPECIES: MFS transporter [unclassified Leisingera]|uniref:MFS transporter n=1 Tax=unclassified Leisingera TaxID=2614906 RepID=UPI0002EAFA90|nr:MULTISPECIES: MFS transporter [unclassified Leisingera]KIC26859.1 major facilitator transporter [Leisingera sp. ANG-S3]KIC50619.1 major facilitator transporter [Leisingera sp. ANG-S]KID07074.1 major facilitator transporter [Leisingera sp. ANG1]
MLSILKNRTYRHLFLAQIVALSGTGLATVALGLLAYDLAGERAGVVLGTALTIKMVAYVTVAPVAAAWAEQVDRRRMLISLDMVRVAVAVCLPFVTEVWQVYLLIFVLQSASAGFTPAFQASIPDVLPEEKDYTQALSLSRMAYELESLISPMLAAALLVLVSSSTLFWGTAAGFAASALLLVSIVLPSPAPKAPRPIWQRTTRGIRNYLRTPRLRGLLAMNWVVSAMAAMVLVNTVVLVRAWLGQGESAVALALACFGGGSMLSAMLLPRLLERVPDRSVMLAGGALGTAALMVLALTLLALPLDFARLAIAWFVIGLGYSAVMTPSGRLLARSAHAADRPAIFAAQFTLSHACWLVFYPLSAWLMASWGAGAAMLVLALLAAAGLIAAQHLWPADSAAPVAHEHPDLPPDHPHLQGGHPHAHPIIIDDLHPRIPQKEGP